MTRILPTERVVVILCAVGIASSAVSISLSHISMALALLLGMIWLLLRRRQSQERRGPACKTAPKATSKAAAGAIAAKVPEDAPGEIEERGAPAAIPAPFLSGLALYAFLLLNTIAQIAQGRIADIWRPFSSEGELAGLPFLLFGLLIWKLSAKKANRLLLYRSLGLLLALLLLSGMIAAFFQMRLGLLILSSFAEIKSSNLLQYPLTQILGIDIYKTRGFLSTSLTYAGMLALFLPLLIALVGRSIQQRRGGASALKLLLLLAFLFTFWATGTRSALLAIAFTLPFPLYRLKRDFLADFSLSKRQLYATATLALLMAIAGVTVVILDWGGARKLLEPFLRYSTFTRQAIWSANGDMIMEHPLLGIGAGNYGSAFSAWQDRFISQNPDLWLFIRNLSSSHAHNDLIHITTVGGIPAGLLFLTMIFYCIRPLFQKQQKRQKWPKRQKGQTDWQAPYLLYGALIFLLAGISECYFQDAEVAALFWIFQGLGLATAARQKSGRQKGGKIGGGKQKAR